MANTTLMSLVTVGIMVIVLGFVLAIGQDITTQNAITVCASDGGSWVQNLSNTTNASARAVVNPLDKSWGGCCLDVNTSYPTAYGYCNNWDTRSYALNSSYFGMTANNTLAYWVPIIALAIAAGFVVSILIIYLLGSVTGRTEANV